MLGQIKILISCSPRWEYIISTPRHISPISDNGIHYPGPIDSPIVTNKSKSSTRVWKTPYAWCGATPRELLPRLKATKFDLKKMSP